MAAVSRRQSALWGFFFVSPWVIWFCLFTIYPLFVAVKMSFQKVNAMLPDKAEFVGFGNWIQAATDPRFWRSLGNVVYNQAIYITLMFLTALLMAVLIHEVKSGKSLFRTVYFLPVVTSVTVAMMVMDYISGPRGPIQSLFLQLGWLDEPVLWKFGKWLPMPVLAVFNSWKWFGVNMLIFLGGLGGIDRTIYEAAHLDGCGWWQRLRMITIPLLNPQIVFVLTMSIIHGLQMFTEVFMLFDIYGGPYVAGLTPVLYLYQVGFAKWNMGYAAALGLLLAVVIFVATQLQFRVVERPRD